VELFISPPPPLPCIRADNFLKAFVINALVVSLTPSFTVVVRERNPCYPQPLRETRPGFLLRGAGNLHYALCAHEVQRRNDIVARGLLPRLLVRERVERAPLACLPGDAIPRRVPTKENPQTQERREKDETEEMGRRLRSTLRYRFCSRLL
jgi:hypothetical protein